MIQFSFLFCLKSQVLRLMTPPLPVPRRPLRLRLLHRSSSSSSFSFSFLRRHRELCQSPRIQTLTRVLLLEVFFQIRGVSSQQFPSYRRPTFFELFTISSISFLPM